MIPTSSLSSKMKILIAIKSAWKHRARREACRKTWLKDLDRETFDYTFILGYHDWMPPTPERPYVSRTNDMGETDVRVFPVDDGFNRIGPKVWGACDLALKQAYDFLVVMDDDTYIRPERIPGLIADSRNCDIVAFFRYETPDKHWPQGAFYIVGPRGMKAMHASSLLVGHSGPDDLLAGEALKGLNGYHSNRIVPGPCHNPAAIGPQGLNDIVSVHKCLPDQMIATHDAWLMSYV